MLPGSQSDLRLSAASENSAFHSGPRYSNGEGGGGPSGRGNNRRRLAAAVDDNKVKLGMERPPNFRHANHASAPTAEPSPLLLDAEVLPAPPPLAVFAAPPKLHQQQEQTLPIVSSTVTLQSASSSSVVAAMVPSSSPHWDWHSSDFHLHSTAALPALLTDRLACDANEMNSLLCADALDRPQHEWSSLSSSEDINNNDGDLAGHQDKRAGDRNDAAEHALHDFGTAARATLATLPAGLIRRLMAKLFQA